jgi:ABC-type tungstate transport system substrate-binding protein
MDLILRGVRHAVELLLRGDPQVMEIMWLSLRVSGLATALSLVVGSQAPTTLSLDVMTPALCPWYVFLTSMPWPRSCHLAVVPCACGCACITPAIAG